MQILVHKCESKKENCFLLVLSLRIVEQRLQLLAQRGWESGRPRCNNQTDLDHISQMGAVLVAVAVEFHLNECLQFDDTFVIDLYSSIHSSRTASTKSLGSMALLYHGLAMGIIRKCREIDAIRYGIAFRVTIYKQAEPLTGIKRRLNGQKNRTQKNESINFRSRNRKTIRGRCWLCVY